eukprot:12739579-Alexandrium_andersonii.AAC.1
MEQLAASLEATVQERDEARATIADMKAKYLGLLSGAREEQKIRGELDLVKTKKIRLNSELALVRVRA